MNWVDDKEGSFQFLYIGWATESLCVPCQNKIIKKKLTKGLSKCPTDRQSALEILCTYIPSFPYSLPRVDLRNTEPGKKPRAALYAVSAVSHCLAPLHKGCFNLEHGLLFECITICSQIAMQRLIVPQSPINILPGYNVHFYLPKCSKLPSDF